VCSTGKIARNKTQEPHPHGANSGRGGKQGRINYTTPCQMAMDKSLKNKAEKWKGEGWDVTGQRPKTNRNEGQKDINQVPVNLTQPLLPTS
jgi:hypothetical protein